ncbi:MAG: hypothetical protein JWO14_469 [Solirubrobacterales bacterium]|nr:hypothetical protein [Solirubrobacterales bacterium]
MPKHLLSSSQQVIDSLLELGESLFYTSEPEWRLEPGTAAIDVAWLRRPGDGVPLIAFEVETTASGGIAANAMKVLGKRSDQLRKPLHLFHIVVSGGLNSDRPIDAATVFGAHNYSIHLFEDDREPLELLENILQVHSRVSDRVDGARLLSVIAKPPWPQPLLNHVANYAKSINLVGITERCLVQLSKADPNRFLPLLSNRLDEIWRAQLDEGHEPPDLFLEPLQPREDEYGSYMASVACEPIELGLIGALRPEVGSKAFDILQRWQEINHIGDKVGPFTGSGTQWTQYEIEHLGYMWGLVAALLFDVPGAARWCAEQPATLLAELRETDAGEVLLLAVWVLHIAGAAKATDIYEVVRDRVERAGGVSALWIARPEPGNPGEDGDWSQVFGEDSTAPSIDELSALVKDAGFTSVDPVGLGLSALLEDPALFPDLGALLAATLEGIRTADADG